MVRFGQVVVGPPGSGKTTYCLGMCQYMKAIGRDAAVINLDPANHGKGLPYTAAVDIQELVSVEGVMEEFNLGPNGAMLYCLEYLEKNVDWLMEKLGGLTQKHLIFDFPGQVELFTHCFCVQNVVQRLQKDDVRLAAVHLVDAYHCGNPSLFISAALLSLMVMLRLELPHVNVLSKVDLIEQMGPLPFNLEFFTECQDMRQLLAYLDAPPDTGEDPGDSGDPAGETTIPGNGANGEPYETAGGDRGRDSGGETGTSGAEHGDRREGDEAAVAAAAAERPASDRTDGSPPRDGGRGAGEGAGAGGGAGADADAAGGNGACSGGGGGGGGGGRRRGRNERFYKMTEEICDVVDSYGLVCFYPLNIQDAETVGRVLSQIDKCNGYMLGAHDTAPPAGGGNAAGAGAGEGSVSNLFRTAFSDTREPMFEKVGSVQERYMPDTYGAAPPELGLMMNGAAGKVEGL
ncbi:unnamed protein product [Ectocarpus fasciculatus]